MLDEQLISIASTLDCDACWQAVMNKDAAADGKFFYSVRTTGVYCRPSCGARLPRRENVDFYRTTEDAERAGFRPCKRCKPHEAASTEHKLDAVTRACRLIESSEALPTLAQLARAASMSPYHFHRTFKAMTGVTPKAYAIAHRGQRMREALKKADRITDAIYDAGFNSNGRFYESTDQVLGMTPAKFRAGGENTSIRFAVAHCSLGAILVAATERGLCAILLGDDPEVLLHDLEDRFPRANLIGADRDFEAMVAKVIGFIEHPRSGLDLPLDIRGTAFQQKVWRALREIPAGETASYSDLAARLGVPKASRAVAAACAANPLAVAVPCHRVVRRDGDLAGYRWGIARKKALLEREEARE
ncbi:MAG TPA: bifunctional DNA-binding transcriptional regulator/O6-methylguanine-DNA methyltransferase Ada [Burkholderiales bacterium]|nr:bifunctional DNA-binding transcriptional regulator/O6-methylguanine-DNA methyltransferase Ada [Burkholderiales bacterium]